MKVTILQNSYVDIKGSNTKLELSLKGFIPSEVFRSACNQIRLYLQENQVSEWLIDQRTMSVHPKDYKWFLEEFIQGEKIFGKNNLVAMVTPENFYCEFTLNRYLQTRFPNGTSNIARFENKADAQDWLSGAHKAFDYPI